MKYIHKYRNTYTLDYTHLHAQTHTYLHTAHTQIYRYNNRAKWKMKMTILHIRSDQKEKNIYIVEIKD